MKPKYLFYGLLVFSMSFMLGCPPAAEQDNGDEGETPAVKKNNEPIKQLPETEDEKAAREIVEYYEGSITKSPEGRIIGIRLDYTDGLELEEVEAFAKLSDLESIYLEGVSINDKHIAALSGLKKLNSVSIVNSERVTIESIKSLKELPELKSLLLRRNDGLKDDSLVLLKSFPKLEKLHILNAYFSEIALEINLGGFTKLKSLDVRNLPVNDNILKTFDKMQNLEELLIKSKVGDAGIEALVKCGKLNRLVLTDTLITPAAVNSLKKMKNLKRLNIFRADRLKEEGVASLGQLTQLETLELRNMVSSNEAIGKLKTLKSLKLIELSEMNIEPAAIIDLLKALPKLERVMIFAVPLVDDSIPKYLASVPGIRQIRLKSTNISDEGLMALTALKKLNRLDIVDNKIKITPQGAEAAFAKMTSLNELFIPETIDTEAVRAAIEKASPGCFVKVDTYSQETGSND